LPEDSIFGQCPFSVSAAGIVAGIAGIAAAAVGVDAENYKRRDYKRPEIIIIAEHSIDLLMYFRSAGVFRRPQFHTMQKRIFVSRWIYSFLFTADFVQKQNSEKEKNILYNKDV